MKSQNEAKMEFENHIKLGATGEYPFGKLNEDDEGEIVIAVSNANGKVIIDFGDKPICWIGFTPSQAHDFAMVLIGRLSDMMEFPE